MTSIERTLWEPINPSLSLYHYKGSTRALSKSSVPILLIHGPMTSHRTWDNLAHQLHMSGCSNILAVDIADIQTGTSVRSATRFLQTVVAYILDNVGDTKKVVLIGHSTGGLLVRRYLLKTLDASHVVLAFTLGTPHTRTDFPHQVFLPPDDETQQIIQGTTTVVRTPYIPSETFLINIFGNGAGKQFDGTVKGVYLPEAVNLEVPLQHTMLKYDRLVVQEILAWLQGLRYRMRFYLQSLEMKTPDTEDGMVGPFCFDVNGMQSPYRGSFLAAAEHPYTFERTNTPLATLGHPQQKKTYISTELRLKDFSRTRSVRRRLMVRLLNSLDDNTTTLHEMQDSEGSQIALRLHIQKMPVLLAYD